MKSPPPSFPVYTAEIGRPRAFRNVSRRSAAGSTATVVRIGPFPHRSRPSRRRILQNFGWLRRRLDFAQKCRMRKGLWLLRRMGNCDFKQSA
jgi:hypothetical protein